MQAGWANLMLSVRASRPMWRPPPLAFLLSLVIWLAAAGLAIIAVVAG